MITKNNTLAAIISLSLLMANMPVKAEENTVSKYSKKTARCAWHLAKIGASLAPLFFIGINLKEDGIPPDKLGRILMAGFFISGCTTLKSGIEGIYKEFIKKEKTDENNEDAKQKPKEA